MALKSAMLAADLAVELAGVFEDGHDQAERRGRERDRQQQRLRDPAGRFKGGTRAVAQDERH